jgi:GMP synthase-like glutamine amidotransferase
VKPVLLLQHLHEDGPGHFGRWLRERGVPVDLRNTEAGDAYPESVEGHAALAILGGRMGANDGLPSLRHAERLIVQAVALGRPVIGHCLGGQLMARALGARVSTAAAPEIGWQRIEVFDGATAIDWFGRGGTFTVFQWHHDTFDLPAGAVALAASADCRHQAFALGPHLALQFHVELDAEKLRLWAPAADPALARRHRAVQTAPEMLAGADTLLQAQQELADRLYRRWWRGAGG